MKTPITIFTGFLGVGKTTIIRNLLQQCPERKFAVVVNEFGDVSIDGSLISNTDGVNIEVSSVTGGLIAYADDDKFDVLLANIGGRTSEFDHLIIETSGLAAPTAVLERLQKTEAASKFILDSVVAVVDTRDILDRSRRAGAMEEVLRRQLEAADIVVLNKMDGVGVDDLVAAEQGLRTLSPQVRFVEVAPQGQVDRRVLLGMHLHATKQMAAMGFAATPAGDVGSHGHTHEGWGFHEHGLHTHEHLHEHDPGWLSFSVHCHEPQLTDKLQKALETILVKEPLFRAKGFFETVDQSVHELQCVRDRVTVTAVPAHDHHHDHDEVNHHAHGRLENKAAKIDAQGNYYGHAPSVMHKHEHVEGASDDNAHTHDHGREHDHGHDHATQHDHGHGSELVFIGYNLTRENVVDHLVKITGTEWH